MNVLQSLLPLVIPCCFAGMWCLVSWILSRRGGWATLAKRFHFPGTFSGKYYYFQSMRVNKVYFSASLEFGVSEEGLYLVPMILFRLFHKPLLIPWHELQAEQFKKWFFTRYRLTIRSFPSMSVEMLTSTFEKIAPYLTARPDCNAISAAPRNSQ